MTAPDRTFTFLVNPASGGGAAPEAVVPVARLLREAGASVEVTYSPGPRATDDLVRAAVGRGDVVVSVGGDGMLSHLAGAVSTAGGVLGVLPGLVGTMLTMQTCAGFLLTILTIHLIPAHRRRRGLAMGLRGPQPGALSRRCRHGPLARPPGCHQTSRR